MTSESKVLAYIALPHILAQYAEDQSPKGDWPNPPYGYDETIVECMLVLLTV
jgi:hypothetical protein